MSDQITNLSGSVKVYFPDKGFGFISTEDLGDVFFHIKNVDEAYQDPQQGDHVVFDAAPSRKKPDSYQALNVMPS